MLEKQSGYMHKPYYQMLILAAMPMLYLRIFHPFSDTNYVHGYMVIILILANFYVITISFHLKSGPSYEMFTQQKFGAIWQIES